MSVIFRLFLSLIIIGTAGFFFWWPKWQDIEQKRVLLKAKEVELDAVEQYDVKLQQTYEKIKTHSKDIERTATALPEYQDHPMFFFLLQDICKQNGVVLTGISPQISSVSLKKAEEAGDKALPQDRVKDLNAGIGITGSYEAMRNFLKAIESSARLVEVESLSFISPEEPGVYSVSLLLKTHSY